MILQHSLPSVVPVALHAVTSPEEHLHRYQAAKEVMANFRRRLEIRLSGEYAFDLLSQASSEIKGYLRYIFNAIDSDRNGVLSFPELANHLYQAENTLSSEELGYLFNSMDIDGNGTIDFSEFGSLMLRHRHMMANYEEFVTYFLPIDANRDDAISLDEMNVAMRSVDEKSLSANESGFLVKQFGEQPLTWNRFIEMLLIL